ncbi:hypothetical protein BDQ12DRAFT_669700 [Crucibulum laeve]|uniref:Uncharacterized protein n=1 Tax=Crucibulum laeve TaxID=68775 RepID=A0A5C3LNG7_9AGAR|nr:hypothetical protein BDQ12DRAFT_669700 [Crucibulum laeve]
MAENKTYVAENESGRVGRWVEQPMQLKMRAVYAAENESQRAAYMAKNESGSVGGWVEQPMWLKMRAGVWASNINGTFLWVGGACQCYTVTGAGSSFIEGGDDEYGVW